MCIAWKPNGVPLARDPLKTSAWIYENLWISIHSHSVCAVLLPLPLPHCPRRYELCTRSSSSNGGGGTKHD